jgi:signal transduction histidine kinase
MMVARRQPPNENASPPQASVEEQLAALQNRLAHVLTDASHQIRNHITIIQSYLEILHGEIAANLSDEQLSFLGIAYDNVELLRDLVEDLILLGALETGIADLEAEPCELGDVVADACNAISARARAAAVALDNRAGSEIGIVLADPRKLQDAVERVLDNAVRFTPAGGAVTVRSNAEADWVQVAIEDTGIGLDAHQLELAFEVMTQLHRKPGDAREGHGLGLPVALAVVRAFGGDLSASSAPGKGSAFRIVLPTADAQAGSS